MTGRISPWAMPSFSQAAAVSSRRRSNVCITVRKALGEHPTCASRRRRPKNSLRVSAPTPRLRPNTNSVATTRRMSQARPASRFPQRRLRVAVSAIHRLEMAMHAAFGKPGSIRQAPDALLAVFTNRVENDNALGPQSHGVGPCSEGWLKSWKKSALQSTRSTTTCPALGGWSPWCKHRSVRP